MGAWDKQPTSPNDRWLRGIWASVPTPMHDNGDLDLLGLSANVAHYTDVLGLEGIYCNGIMGECWSLTLEERMEVAAAAVAAAASRLKIGIVVTAGSPKETIQLARHAEEIGAHHIVLSPPTGHYSTYEILRYVCMVRERVTVPLVVVEASSRGFGIDVVRFLASHPGLISAIKIGSSRDHVAQLSDQFGRELIITDPYEANWLSNLKDFGMKVLYADPEPYLFQSARYRPIDSYYNAFVEGNFSKAEAIHDSLKPVRALYDQKIMQPLRSGVAPIATLKAWCEYVGLVTGPPREPLLPLAMNARLELHKELESTGVCTG